ncbi:MAG: DJ-1/PfpI family protein [Salinarimonas sp.]
MRTGVAMALAITAAAGVGLAWWLTRSVPAEALARVEEPVALRAIAGERPLVVVLADNAGTETTDLLVPHGILQRSGLVDVRIVSTEPGRVTLMPALAILADETIAGFEAEHPEGADVVVVPALHSRGTPATSRFLQEQAARGALVVSICEGAEVVARAGLLDGRAATTHWHAHDRLARSHPPVAWRRNARYVVDGPVISSAGVSASVPVTLALLEILAGTPAARDQAVALGIARWDAHHDSDAFGMRAGDYALAASNIARFWRHETLGTPVANGLDGVALALQADAWSRTWRSTLVAVNEAGRVVSAEGVTLLTEEEAPHRLAARTGAPIAALDATLAGIAERYGAPTARFVALQLEHPWAGL